MSLVIPKTFLWNETVWNPRMLGARAWYDASDTATVSATGGLVDSVIDKSGNGLTLTSSLTARPTYTSSGLNGRNVFTFDGSDDALTSASAAPWTFLHDATGNSIFAVFKAGNTSDPNALYTIFGTNRGTSTQTGAWLYYDDRLAVPRNNKIVYLASNGGTSPVFAESADNFCTPNTAVTLSAIIDPANATASARSSIRVDGGTASTTNTSSGTPATGAPAHALQLGSHGNNGLYFAGYIAEIFFVSGVLSTLNRQKAEGYLAHKWGLEANLPSDHPYKSYGPKP